MELESIVKYLATEWGVILQAPTIFATGMMLFAALVWAVLRWSYVSRIEVLDGRLKLRDDQIADYKQKLSGASPDEARNRIDALELEIAALAPRRLSVKQREDIPSVIRGLSYKICVIQDISAGDARRFERDLCEIFSIGWMESRKSAGDGSRVPSTIRQRYTCF